MQSPRPQLPCPVRGNLENCLARSWGCADTLPPQFCNHESINSKPLDAMFQAATTLQVTCPIDFQGVSNRFSATWLTKIELHMSKPSHLEKCPVVLARCVLRKLYSPLTQRVHVREIFGLVQHGLEGVHAQRARGELAVVAQRLRAWQ